MNTGFLAYMVMLRSRCRQYSCFLNQGPVTFLSHVARDLQLQSILTVILVVIVSPVDQEQDVISFSLDPLPTGEVQNNRVVK